MKKKPFAEEQIIGALKALKALRQRLSELATKYPRYGYLMFYSQLKQEGLVVNKKRTYRLYAAMGL